jgi:copper chaperone CopZ
MNLKKRWIALLTALLLSSASAFAAGQEIKVAVKGMVCGFCAQGIEKKFSAEPSVEKVKVSLSDKQVTLTLKDGQGISDDLIKKILSDAGYNVEKVERN